MNGSKSPYIDLARQYEYLKEELLEAQDLVYSSGRVMDSDRTKAFEMAMAKRCGRRFAVAVNSCTTALMFALQIVNHRPDDGVLLPSFSFVASANAVMAARRTPFFSDVDEQGLLNIDTIDRHLPDHNISTLMFVNMYGNMVDQDKLSLYTGFFNPSDNVTVIEDAAQSFGSAWKHRPSGSFGDISCLSFDPMKNLPNYGSGGMLLTDDTEYYSLAMDLRDNGKHGHHFNWGINSKMSESDCAGMLVKLGHFDLWQERRTEIAEYYNMYLEDHITIPEVSDHVIHSWHKYVIRSGERNRMRAYLSSLGIETKVHYDYTLPELDYPYPGQSEVSDYATARELAHEVLSLPIFPEMTDAEVETVVEAVRDFRDIR